MEDSLFSRCMQLIFFILLGFGVFWGGILGVCVFCLVLGFVVGFFLVSLSPLLVNILTYLFTEIDFLESGVSERKRKVQYTRLIEQAI